MALSVRPRVYSLPSYSLTGDLISFLRCGLQYRYTRIGRLPSTRPIQMWFGQFIHGVLDEAYRRYRQSIANGTPSLPPWPPELLEEIRELIKTRLAAQGLFPWDPELEELGDQRADACINELGPFLLPIIQRTEVKLTGSRMIPAIQPQHQFREADRYEMVGVVDVVTNMELNNPDLQNNPIVQVILSKLPQNLPDKFEVILDYKGMCRPPFNTNLTTPSLWSQYEWQIQTYGELRRRASDALPVVAGVLLYVNEILPTHSDIDRLRKEIANGLTDIIPPAGSVAETFINNWTSSGDPSGLPIEYRLARTLRVIPIDDNSINNSLAEFDQVVARIETCRGQEVHGMSILDAWETNSSDEGTCTICDWRICCQEYQSTYARAGNISPKIPGVRARKK